MKILYGVQGTGNGHITRARVMSQALKKHDIEVDYLFSGRAFDAYFDMGCFRSKTYRHGLTFQIIDGEIKYFKTFLHNKLLRFYHEIKACDLNGYDCVISDFEPISAWAGKRQSVPVLGVGHQYVFDYPVPQQQPNWMSRQIFNKFAPAQHKIPLHWHHFNAPILPPIIDTTHEAEDVQKDLVLVYLPFENQEKITAVLSQVRDHQFIIYSAQTPITAYDNVQFKALSRSGFQRDLQRCGAVIANAGFELSSEAIHLGKRLLVRPLHRQTEQISNAIALQQLGYGHAMQDITVSRVKSFLADEQRVRVQFPDVASYVAQWVQSGMPERSPGWFQQLWQQVVVTPA